MSKKLKVKLMLDSGAFSAWSRNEELPLMDYIAYLKDHKHLCFSYVNMDQIPGKFGRRRTQLEVDASAKKSYENLQVMKKHGLHPIPVFHQDEQFTWLERMLKDGEPYIGFSSGKDNQPDVKRAWLDTVFTMITDSTGKPFIKTHGFGITRPIWLFRYPWTTVDSTTWSMTPGYGTIIVPRYINGKPDYSKPAVNFIVSGREQKSSSAQKKQLEGQGANYLECLTHFIEEEVGVSLAAARYDSNARRKAALIYYLKMAEHLKDIKFHGRNVGLLNGNKNYFGKKRAIEHTQTLIMFATSMRNSQWSELLTECHADTRLLSYYETKELTMEKLEHYVTHGFLTARKQRLSVKQEGWEESYLNFRRLRTLEKLDAAKRTTGPAGDGEPGAS